MCPTIPLITAIWTLCVFIWCIFVTLDMLRVKRIAIPDLTAEGDIHPVQTGYIELYISEHFSNNSFQRSMSLGFCSRVVIIFCLALVLNDPGSWYHYLETLDYRWS